MKLRKLTERAHLDHASDLVLMENRKDDDVPGDGLSKTPPDPHRFVGNIGQEDAPFFLGDLANEPFAKLPPVGHAVTRGGGIGTHQAEGSVFEDVLRTDLCVDRAAEL